MKCAKADALLACATSVWCLSCLVLYLWPSMWTSVLDSNRHETVNMKVSTVVKVYIHDAKSTVMGPYRVGVTIRRRATPRRRSCVRQSVEYYKVPYENYDDVITVNDFERSLLVGTTVSSLLFGEDDVSVLGFSWLGSSNRSHSDYCRSSDGTVTEWRGTPCRCGSSGEVFDKSAIAMRSPVTYFVGDACSNALLVYRDTLELNDVSLYRYEFASSESTVSSCNRASLVDVRILSNVSYMLIEPNSAMTVMSHVVMAVVVGNKTVLDFVIEYELPDRSLRYLKRLSYMRLSVPLVSIMMFVVSMSVLAMGVSRAMCRRNKYTLSV